MDETYTVGFVEPGNQFIEPGSESVTCDRGAEVKVGQLDCGRWLAWIPYQESGRKKHDNPMRAISWNKYVATGAVKDYYYG